MNAAHRYFARSLANFFDLRFGNALDVAQRLLRLHGDTLNGGDSGGLELGDVGRVDSVLLEFINALEECLRGGIEISVQESYHEGKSLHTSSVSMASPMSATTCSCSTVAAIVILIQKSTK